MEKQTFKFINEGNGIEGLVPTSKIYREEKAKVMVIDKNSKFMWDPLFECFVPKTDSTLEKGTVKVHIR